MPFIDFEPEIPNGFQTADAFLEKFVHRPELKGLMAEARKRIENSRSAQPGHKNGLAALRRSAGLSQQDLAEKIGTVQPVISLYEAGDREPSLKAIFALAEALGVTFDRLLPALKE